MWPYMIKPNPVGLLIIFTTCVTVYLIYTSSNLTNQIAGDIKNRKDDLILEKSVDLKRLLVTLMKAAQLGGKEVVNVLKENDLKSRRKLRKEQKIDEILTHGDVRSHLIMVHQVSVNFPGLKIISEEKHANDDTIHYLLPLRELPELFYFDDIRHLPNQNIPIEDIIVWIDPLDASQEYSENLTQYVTTMACVAVRGVATIGIIHEPFTGVTYWAWKDTGISVSIDEILNSNEKHMTTRNNSSDMIRFIISRTHSGRIEKKLKHTFRDKHIEIKKAGGSGYKAMQLVKSQSDVYVHITGIKKWDICAPNAILSSIPNGYFTDLSGNAIDFNDDDVWSRKGLVATLGNKHREVVQKLRNSH